MINRAPLFRRQLVNHPSLQLVEELPCDRESPTIIAGILSTPTNPARFCLPVARSRSIRDRQRGDLQPPRALPPESVLPLVQMIIVSLSSRIRTECPAAQQARGLPFESLFALHSLVNKKALNNSGSQPKGSYNYSAPWTPTTAGRIGGGAFPLQVVIRCRKKVLGL